MANLCDFCCELVDWEKGSSRRESLVRKLQDLTSQYDQQRCPFCEAFLESLLKERPDANMHTNYHFAVQSNGKGLVRLTISSFRLQNDRVDEICHWMIANPKVEHFEASNRFHERADWRSHTMDMTTRLSRIDKWLAECVSQRNSSHKCCSKRQVVVKGYPSRLLDVSDFDISGYVKVVDTREWPKPKPQYTTLSHCWGSLDGPRPLETKRSNLGAHKTGINFKNLPKTFSDAAEITFYLNQNFLWIDSLCIIQDDHQDWEHEAALMGAIYENSFLTIAATSSRDCEGGCDLEPWDLKIFEGRAVSIAKNTYERHSRYPYAVRLKRTHASWTQLRERPPLYRRGWVLQETYLSRRILHMATHHMLWQCRKIFDQEDVNVLQTDDDALPIELSSVGFVWRRLRHQQVWRVIVDQYPRMEFTYPSDRLPAFAGITQVHAALLHLEPLLGLWNHSIDLDLGWMVADPQDSRISGLPTWTWFSSPAARIIPNNGVSGATNRLELVDWCITWQGKPYVSKLISGTLRVRTRLFKTTVHSANRKSTTVRGNFHKFVINPFIDAWNGKGGALASRETLIFNQDVSMTDESTEDTTITYMLLWTSKYNHRYLEAGGSCTEKVSFLALLGIPGKPTRYVRIGFGKVEMRLSKDTSRITHPDWPKDGFSEHILRTWRMSTIELC